MTFQFRPACSVDDCSKPSYCKGMCRMHYSRVWRGGDVRKGDLKFNFEQRIRKEENGCWTWTGGYFKSGYGKLRVGGKTLRANRVAYEIFIGPIGRLHVLHKCDNPACVNPDHLWIGTHKENMDDMKNKKRYNLAPAFKVRGLTI